MGKRVLGPGASGEVPDYDADSKEPKQEPQVIETERPAEEPKPEERKRSDRVKEKRSE